MKRDIVKVKIFICFHIFNLCLLHPNLLHAQNDSLGAPAGQITKQVQYGFTFDQDMLLEFFQLAKKNEDRNYTMGLGLFVSNNLWADRKFFSPFRKLQLKINRFNTDKSLKRNASVCFGATGFTPRYLRDNIIDSLYYMINDRPFASLTFLSFKYQEVSAVRVETNQLVIAALGLGIAREVQTYIHKNHWFKSTRDIPTGWKYQVSNGFDPTFLFSNKADLLLNTKSLNNHHNVLGQFIFSREYRLGYYTEANAGIGMRFGRIDPKRWSSYDMYQLDYAAHYVPSTEKLKSELYLQVMVRPYIVLYNALLNGQFRKSFHTFSFSEIEHIVAEGFAGVGGSIVNCKKNFSTNVLVYISGRTPEFKTALSNRSHLWGGVQLLFTHIKTKN
jgi:hypothetical protein